MNTRTNTLELTPSEAQVLENLLTMFKEGYLETEADRIDGSDAIPEGSKSFVKMNIAFEFGQLMQKVESIT